MPAQGRRQREAREAPFFRRQDGRGRIRALSSFSADYLIMVGGGCGRGLTHFQEKEIMLDVGRIKETRYNTKYLIQRSHIIEIPREAFLPFF